MATPNAHVELALADIATAVRSRIRDRTGLDVEVTLVERMDGGAQITAALTAWPEMTVRATAPSPRAPHSLADTCELLVLGELGRHILATGAVIEHAALTCALDLVGLEVA